MIDVSFVIVSFNTSDFTNNCLKSIYEYIGDINFEVIVVDNASIDDSKSMISSNFPEVKLIQNVKNVGFSAANNQGISIACGTYICLLNSDTYFNSNFIVPLINFCADRPDQVSVAPVLLNVDGSLQRSFFNFPSIPKITVHSIGLTNLAHNLVGFFLKLGLFKSSIYNRELKVPVTVPYVIFACVLFKKDVIKRVGLLDEDFRFYHEDCDYGYRLFNNEVKQFIVPESTITHIGGGSSSRNSVFSFENYYYGLLLFYKKHAPVQFRVLQAVLVFVFLFRSLATIVGGYKTLSLPSTYGFDHGLQPFSSPFKRCLYYFGFISQITSV